jgi:hypothetical protein
MQAPSGAVNYRVGLFIRVPERISSIDQRVNRRTSMAESRASYSIPCREISSALIPEELLDC